MKFNCTVRHNKWNNLKPFLYLSVYLNYVFFFRTAAINFIFLSVSTTMDTYGTEVKTANDENDELDKDPQLNIPLRQRRLPASFWQEPSLAQSSRSPDFRHVCQSTAHQVAVTPPYPWAMNSTTTLPVFIPQRFTTPGNFLLQQNSNSHWVRGSSSSCACSSCLNYSYVVPRLPDVYSGMRYRPAVSIPCCPTLSCTDQGCKVCSTFERWHPERLRHLRLRAARYNALIDWNIWCQLENNDVTQYKCATPKLYVQTFSKNFIQ